MAVGKALILALRRLRASLLLPLPLLHSGWLLAAMLIGVASGAVVLWLHPLVLDQALYDRIVSQTQRPAARHTARLVFDLGVPDSVSREQSLTLYALAAERLLALGASTVMLDAQITLRNWRQHTFAACIDGERARWCQLGDTASPCSSAGGRRRSAPLDFDAQARRSVTLPFPLSEREPPPYDWLFGRALAALPALVSPALPPASDGIVREAFADRDSFLADLPPAGGVYQPCTDGSGRACQAIRFSKAVMTIPLSEMASCGDQWRGWRNLVQHKWVVLQLTGIDESTDLHLTPMQALRSGSWIMADSIETALQNDMPRRLPTWAAIVLVLLAAPLAVLVCAWIRPAWLLVCLAILAGAFPYLATALYPWARWPLATMLATILAAAACMLLGHFWLHSRQHAILARLVPPQTRQLLLNTRNTRFTRRKLLAVVLMSDLAGYTSLTNRLADPEWLLLLLDRYLDTVTRDLQQKYGGWLENYVADMVCYFWPVLQQGNFCQTQAEARQQALAAALTLVNRQQAFFADLPLHMPELDADTLTYTQAHLYAGVAVCEGEVVLGEFGPRHGSRKFGILGDPANLASRLEALTRMFCARLLISDELQATAAHMGLLTRRVANIQVKGRAAPGNVWAIYSYADGITRTDIDRWHEWLAALEASGAGTPCAGPFKADSILLLQWLAAGWWRQELRCFRLESK